MLLSILEYLQEFNSAFRALTYTTSRMILSLVTSITLSVLIYPPLIRWLRSIKLEQPIREIGPQNHHEKKGTPTMGGVVIIFSTLLSALLWTDLSNRHLWTLVFVAITYGAIGFMDDYLKITKKNSDGLSSRKKMLGLIIFGLGTIGIHLGLESLMVPANATGVAATEILIPFVKDFSVDIGYFFVPFALLVLVGTSNAVNLTDGLDGLVIGPVITCSGALLILSFVTGNVTIAEYLLYFTVHGTSEVTIFLSALIGSAIGFLWYNTWPAQVFMGDSGSLPLGGILATVSLITHHELLLVIMGGIFVVEAL